MAVVVHEVLARSHRGHDRGAALVAQALVELGDFVSGQEAGPFELVFVDSAVGVRVIPHDFGEEQNVVQIAGRRLPFVLQQLVDEGPGIGRVLGRGPTDGQVGVEVDRIVDLPEHVVGVRVPGSVQIREVQVARQGILSRVDIALADHCERLAERDDVDVAAEQDVFHAGIGQGLDVVAQPLRVVAAGVGAGYPIDVPDNGADALLRLPVGQALEYRVKRRRRYDDVVKSIEVERRSRGERVVFHRHCEAGAVLQLPVAARVADRVDEQVDNGPAVARARSGPDCGLVRPGPA